MKQSRLIMGMPVSVEVVDAPQKNQSSTLKSLEQRSDLGFSRTQSIIARAFDYFSAVDARFSTYKEDSEISRFNRGGISEQHFSPEMLEVFALAEQTKKETDGYFDIWKCNGSVDPSGIVKGWAIRNAANLIADAGYKHFFVEAGGDIEARGFNERGEPWRVGIRNPFNPDEIVKVVHLSNAGIATSGTYERGLHIYNPKTGDAADEIASITVVGLDALEADRFATAAFAMGERGIEFTEQKSGLEAYQIGKNGIATMTAGFNALLL